MKLLLITNLFAPDELAGASLFSDLAAFLRTRGHDIRVTTTFSYYPAWKLRPEDQGIRVRNELYHDIPVRRVQMYVPRQPTGRTRLLSDLSFLKSLVLYGRHSGWEPEVIITALPMLSQCLAQRFLYFGRRIPRFIVVQDFAVEAALELGILKLPGAGRFLHGIQRWALRSAKTLTTISPLMLAKLDRVVGSDRRTIFIPNWIHGSLQAEIDRQEAQPEERSQFRLFYSGNLGIKQGLPDFLEQLANAGGSDWDWQLRIHGGGAERERLEGIVSNMPWCQLRPILEEPEYIKELRTTTACLITQRSGVGANFLPSKLLPALATGTPVLAVCDPSSPLGQEVRLGNFGEVVAPGDSPALRAILQSWRRDPSLLMKMSVKAKERALRYGRARILKQYETELQALAVNRD